MVYDIVQVGGIATPFIQELIASMRQTMYGNQGRYWKARPAGEVRAALGPAPG